MAEKAAKLIRRFSRRYRFNPATEAALKRMHDELDGRARHALTRQLAETMDRRDDPRHIGLAAALAHRMGVTSSDVVRAAEAAERRRTG